MSVLGGFGVRRLATVDRVPAYKCSACGVMHATEAEAQRHVDRFARGCWEPRGEFLHGGRDDGIVHLSSYYWLTGPTLTHRAICDGHPVWILGKGLAKDDCPVCAQSVSEATRALEVVDPSTVSDHLPDNDESRGHESVR